MSLFPKIANMLESPSRCRGRVHSQRHSTLALAKNEVGTLLEQRVNSELFRRRRSFFGFGSENKEDRGSGKTVQLSSAPTRFVAWNIQPPTHFHQRARRFPPTDRKTLINIHDMMRHKRRNAHAHTHTPLDTCTQNCFGGTNSRKLEDSFRHRRETGWPTSHNQQLQEVVTFNPYSWNDS